MKLARLTDGKYQCVADDDPQATHEILDVFPDIRQADEPELPGPATVTLHTPEARALAREYLEWRAEHRPEGTP